MLSRAWLTIAQHVFQPALTGRPELISRKIVSGEPGTKAIAVSRFREKLTPANWVQGVTAISRKILRSWAPKKWGPTCDRDISNSAIYTTAIYRAYTVYGFTLSRLNPRPQRGIHDFDVTDKIISIYWLHQNLQRSRLCRPISKIRRILLMDAKTWITSLIIMFAVRPIYVQDSIFKMSSKSPDLHI